MPDFCTCGARLPEDALFCHKCGKPQREDLIPVEEAEPAEAVVTPPVLPVAPPEPLPINLRNVAAVRSAVASAALSFALLLLAGPLGLVALFGSGFFAVYLYHRRTGQHLSMLSGARLGVIAGTFIFLIALALAASATLLSDPGTFDELRQELIKRSAQPEAEVRQALEYIRTPAGMILLGSFFYLFFTSLPAFGGALGAKFLDRH